MAESETLQAAPAWVIDIDTQMQALIQKEASVDPTEVAQKAAALIQTETFLESLKEYDVNEDGDNEAVKAWTQVCSSEGKFSTSTGMAARAWRKELQRCSIRCSCCHNG